MCLLPEQEIIIKPGEILLFQSDSVRSPAGNPRTTILATPGDERSKQLTFDLDPAYMLTVYRFGRRIARNELTTYYRDFYYALASHASRIANGEKA